ncbi:hypothetical protein [Flavobacterium sp. ZT3R18]|uniref:hypothetical protein n=1 Tax=Flavobacterium sp. ZT3R18 TaxID=2594429 RepID=UPI00163D4BE5|nr:hypothetical protein [Flavobacterium sp. ZT3R18]
MKKTLLLSLAIVIMNCGNKAESNSDKIPEIKIDTLQDFKEKNEKYKVTFEKHFNVSNINDTVFKDVIEITDNNVATNGKDYLFDISISKTIKVPVVFVQAQVPLNLLPHIYPEFSRIIVVSPNWKYYQEMSNQKLGEGLACEPMASSIIYEFKRENNRVKKDSLVLMGSFPKMEFANKSKPETNKVEVYFSESYGSVCCPRDEQWDNRPSRDEFAANFEKINKIKITNTYREPHGKEGEAFYYYSLKGLSNKLKLNFILERTFSRIINRHLKDLMITPKIYTPTILEVNNRMKKT